jgi:hypothetical protein
MDVESARGYAFDRNPSVYYYLRFFSPQRYANAMMTLPERRVEYYGDLHIDGFGSGLMKVEDGKNYGLRYQEIEADPACVDALVQLSNEMKDKGIRFVIAFPPVHPAYRRLYPQSMASLARIVGKAKAMAPSSVVLDYHADARFSVGDFFDAFHLVSPAARRLSDMIASSLDQKPAIDPMVNRRKSGAVLPVTAQPDVPAKTLP